MCASFAILASCVLLQAFCVCSKDPPEILNNRTFLDTENDDIAHFTCKARGDPRPSITWEKAGVVVRDTDEGIAILSSSNNTIEESHLFIAVTGDQRRGEYICVVSNVEGVAKQTFEVKARPSRLSTLDKAAIGISVGLTVLFLGAISFLLWRGLQKIKKSKEVAIRRRRSRTISESSGQENGLLVPDTGTKKGQRTSNGPKKEQRMSNGPKKEQKMSNGTVKYTSCVTSV